VLCPVVVGRSAQQAALLADLAAAGAGRGRTVALVGDAGMGKSRLVRQLGAVAEEQGLAVLSGRAVPSAAAVPLRSLSEAVLGAQRVGIDVDDARLGGFSAQLRRLLPDINEVPVGDGSPVLLGEALVRLLRMVAEGAGDRGCVLVIEDLHWADPETLAVIEYVADAAHRAPLLCVLTLRPDGGAPAALVERLRVRGSARVEPLGPLSAAEQRQMIAACLGDAPLASDVDAFIAEHSDGVPFLVEELLAGLVATAALEHTPLGWRAVRAMTPAIPGSLQESLRARMDRLGPGGRRAVGAAATLGRQFDWELLPGVAGLDGTSAVEAMRAAIAEQLVVVEGSGFRFRHALTREAVLAQLLPPERREFSARALTGVRRAHPGLPGPWCELAAELAEAAGDADNAASLLVESAQRAVRRGAFATATNTSLRAADLADSPATARRAREVQVDALVRAGDASGAEVVGAALVDDLELPADRRAAIHLQLARAAVAAGGTGRAEDHIGHARELRTDALAAEIDAVAALVALDAERPVEATRLAHRAREAARSAGLPDVECEALGVLGRVTPDGPKAIEIFERMRLLAEQHGLQAWRVLALQEIALRRTVTEGSAAMTEARRVAVETGSFVTVAQLDLLLAELALGWFDQPACEAAAQRCVDSSRRFGLATLPVALMWLAGARALADDEPGMEDALAQALAVDPHDERIIADSLGRVRATLCEVREDWSGLEAALETSMTHVRRAPPSRSLYLGQLVWLVLRARDDPDYGAAARAEVSAAPLAELLPGTAALMCADAIVLGRRGERDTAQRRYLEAREVMATASPGFFMGALVDRIVTEAAIRDGWGTPGAWLREIEAFHESRGYHRIARACRALMTAAGSPAPRRGRGDHEVPPGLRAVGVTSRELDVLVLVREGLGNRDIAERLHLSPRTVEHHVSRMLQRTGARTRAELAEIEIR
jgi:DNA-binding CsgD family transcriptional regulator